MSEVLYNPKIKPEHLARKAIVYLRQSSDKQVRQNKESQLLQYAVAERVRALGWQQVEIIARGNTLIHIVNGQVITVSVDEDPANRAPQGILSLQLEGSGQIWYRNVYVKHLPQ